LSELQSLLPTIASSSLSLSETQVDSSNKPEKRTIFYGYSFRFRRRSYNVVRHWSIYFKVYLIKPISIILIDQFM